MSNIVEYRNKNNDELKELSISLKKELFNLRFQLVSGELTNNSRFKEVRRNVARVKTLLTAKSPLPKIAVKEESINSKKTAFKKKLSGE